MKILNQIVDCYKMLIIHIKKINNKLKIMFKNNIFLLQENCNNYRI